MSVEKWDRVILPSDESGVNLNFKEIWRYRDLLVMMLKRDFVTQYKQTVLGPLWFFIQPIFTTVMFTVVFKRLANISTDGIPAVLFYMSGIVCWGYFADCLNKTAVVFNSNQHIFGKVYFPRIISPLSIVVSSMLKFGVQLTLFMVILLVYGLVGKFEFNFTYYMLLFPILILTMALLSLGIGMLISSWTTKYRDLTFLLQFLVQLLMYATPIIVPMSVVGDKKWIFVANPMTGVIETFRQGFLGVSGFEWSYLFYSVGFALVSFIVGLIVFNKTEKNFMDTV